MESRVDPQSETADDSIALVGLAYVIVRRWKMVVALCLLGSLLVGVYSLLLPKEYDATASVLPPPDPGGAGRLRLSSARLDRHRALRGSCRARGPRTYSSESSRVERCRTMPSRNSIS